MKIINIVGFISIIIGFIVSVMLSVIFAIILPASTSKYLLLFYIIGLSVLLFLMLISEIMEISNKNTNEPKKIFSDFKDNSMQSYLYYTILIVPLAMMVLITIVFDITQRKITPEIILQIVYWTIAVTNFMWFCWHLHKANTLNKVRKLNLTLKLTACIVSGLGLSMDLIAQINFTKQFIVITWIIFLSSYLIERKSMKYTK